ncbi:methyl-CpG binding domain-containing protein 4 [Colletotrichum karsti]|uniref:Methyl-CpG binding domain-containing protein 4 n=1 Tax=Colletotrichum karsti TaxID=1095194 RepID=A0A9P6I959_9PEZI|nr:methyl-CpG binding domain-containing protein 4 [Colletotrichum karsti]KAF9879147.1 methyl-CpG binding domain-containing protein 4 [Colletotrichum karsti]
MARPLAQDFFVGFDVSDHDKAFLLEILTNPGTPLEEKVAIYETCLFSGFQDWQLMLERAASIRKNNPPPASELDARDVLAYVQRPSEDTLADERVREAWAATDQSIKKLAAMVPAREPVTTQPPADVPRPSNATPADEGTREPWAATNESIRKLVALLQEPAIVNHEDHQIIKREGVAKREREDDAQDKRVKRRRTASSKATSHYFAQPADEQPSQQPASPAAGNVQAGGTSAVLRNGIATPRSSSHKSTEIEAAGDGPSDPLQARNAANIAGSSNGGNDDIAGDLKVNGPRTARALRANVPTRRSTRLAPSPSLTPSSGAITSPFFASAPAQSPVKQSPKKRNGGLVSTIPFPPLSAPKFGLIQEEFAHDPFWLMTVVTFLVKTAGTVAIPTFYKVKETYPTPAHLADPDPATASSITKPHPTETTAADDAWEMGHFTQGKYALDSWRIFCRDELLGRARDWNGAGAAPNFQPEWMRVRPDDKELRACLRWMWMREGWEWDPATGERTVLREEMRRAVEEKRVTYDEVGGLRILSEPRPE